MKEYKCTLDTLAGYIVPGFIIIIGIIITAGAFVSPNSIHVPAFMNKEISVVFFGPVLLGGISIAMYVYKPLSLLVDDYSITVNRKISPVTIQFSDISSIRIADDLRYTIRTFGNGGLFGYTGKYYKNGIGSMTWYCTQRENYVLIEKTNGAKIVVTPDDRDGFIQDIAQKHSFLIAKEQTML